MNTAREWISNLQDESYARYVRLFSLADTSEINDGHVYVNDVSDGSEGGGFYKVTCPVYKNISFERMRAEQQAKSAHLASIQKNSSVNKDAIVLKKILAYIEAINLYDAMVNSGQYDLDIAINSELIKKNIRKLDKKINVMKDSIQNATLTQDAIKSKRKKMIGMMSEKHKLEEELGQSHTSKIDFILIKLPHFEDAVKPKKKSKKIAKAVLEDADDTVVTENAKSKAKQRKLKSPTNPQPIPSALKNIITSSILSNFPFQSTTECSSAKRSQPYYISQKKMIELIAENEDLRKIFPKNYKTLKKEDLCRVLFPNENTN
jgi:hypothetical protein